MRCRSCYAYHCYTYHDRSYSRRMARRWTEHIGCSSSSQACSLDRNVHRETRGLSGLSHLDSLHSTNGCSPAAGPALVDSLRPLVTCTCSCACACACACVHVHVACIEWIIIACDTVMRLSHASPGMLDQLEWMAVAMKTQRDATGLWA